jgi:isoaspartyl peptidase/L-asparaginase-like protein (Ntn-hydrolase superfamily)
MRDGRELRRPVVIATWPFGLPAVRAAWAVLARRGTSLDAVVEAATYCEDDESVDSVGYGGLPDASGEVTLDAAVMDHRARCGSVACLRRVRHAAKVARAVMEKTPHVMLAGEAATAFALAQGFREEDLLSPRAAEPYARWRAEREGAGSPRTGPAPSTVAQPRVNDAPVNSHDTIGILAVDGTGVPGAACTTSGRAFKLPGRVGDSPIIGAGLYVDGKVGAATTTGVGEEVIRVCGSYAAVDLMRRGAEPAEALAEVLRRVEANRGGRDVDVSLLALRNDGAWAGMTLRAETNFQFAVADAAGAGLVSGGVLPTR